MATELITDFEPQIRAWYSAEAGTNVGAKNARIGARSEGMVVSPRVLDLPLGNIETDIDLGADGAAQLLAMTREKPLEIPELARILAKYPRKR